MMTAEIWGNVKWKAGEFQTSKKHIQVRRKAGERKQTVECVTQLWRNQRRRVGLSCVCVCCEMYVRVASCFERSVAGGCRGKGKMRCIKLKIR